MMRRFCYDDEKNTYITKLHPETDMMMNQTVKLETDYLNTGTSTYFTYFFKHLKKYQKYL